MISLADLVIFLMLVVIFYMVFKIYKAVVRNNDDFKYALSKVNEAMSAVDTKLDDARKEVAEAVAPKPAPRRKSTPKPAAAAPAKAPAKTTRAKKPTA